MSSPSILQKMFTTIYSIDPGETTGMARARVYDTPNAYDSVSFAETTEISEVLEIGKAWLATDATYKSVILIEGVPEYKPDPTQLGRVAVCKIFFRDYSIADETHIILPGTWKPMGKRFRDNPILAGKSPHIKDAWGMLEWWATLNIWRQKS